MQPYLLALLAEAYGMIQQADTGLQVLTEALTWGEQSGEHWYDAEIYRLKGKLLWQRSQPAKDIEQELCRALDLARPQHARVLELRAAISLCRLWQQQGKRAEAREFLAPIYGWFTEGFDTVDLREAQVLLKKLSR
jgi:predicted ATPase